MMSTPILLKSSSGVQTVAIESKLMSDRRLFITGEINADSAMDFFKQMMLLNLEDDKAPISVFINSPGGEIDNGLLIYDAIVASDPHLLSVPSAADVLTVWGQFCLPVGKSDTCFRTASLCSMNHCLVARLAAMHPLSNPFPKVCWRRRP